MTDTINLVWLDKTDQPSKTVVRRQAAKWSHHHGERRRKKSKKPDEPQVSGDISVVENATGLQSHSKGHRRPPNTNPPPSSRVYRDPSPEAIARAENLLFPRHISQTCQTVFKFFTGQIGLDWLVAVSDSSPSRVVQQSLSTIAYGLSSVSCESLLFRESAARQYAELIQFVHGQLRRPVVNQSIDTLNCILISSYIELLVWNDSRTWMVHLDGMARAMAIRSPDEFSSKHGRLMLRTFKHFAIALYLFKRMPCFMAGPQWADAALEDIESHNPRDTIADVLLIFPGIMQKYDQYKDSKIEFSIVDNEVKKYIDTLERWKKATMTVWPVLSPYLQTYQRLTEEGASRLMVYDETNNVDTVLTLSLYLAAWLLLTRVGTKYLSELPQAPSVLVNDIRYLCQRQLSQNGHSGALPWMLPLRIAIHSPTEENVSGMTEFCDHLVKHPLLSFVGSILEALPGLNERADFMTEFRKKAATARPR